MHLTKLDLYGSAEYPASIHACPDVFTLMGLLCYSAAWHNMQFESTDQHLSVVANGVTGSQHVSFTRSFVLKERIELLDIFSKIFLSVW